MDDDLSESRRALNRFNVHVMTANVLSLVAIVPRILHGRVASHTQSPTILASTHAFEAFCFIMVVFIRGRRRAPQTWMSSTLVRAVRQEIKGVTG